jgi:hypothetical protein
MCSEGPEILFAFVNLNIVYTCRPTFPVLEAAAESGPCTAPPLGCLWQRAKGKWPKSQDVIVEVVALIDYSPNLEHTHIGQFSPSEGPDLF